MLTEFKSSDDDLKIKPTNTNVFGVSKKKFGEIRMS